MIKPIVFEDAAANPSISISDRIIATPSQFARNTCFYVQEVGRLKSIRPHTARRKNLDSFLFLIVTAGSGTFSYCGTEYLMNYASCALIDCRREYSHISSEEDPWELMWVHFNGPEAAGLYQYFLEITGQPVFCAGDPLVFSSPLAALLDIHKEHGFLVELEANKYITDIITGCFMNSKRTVPGSLTSVPEKIHQVQQYINGHFQEKLTLESLSERFFISKYHLAREFKKAYGITIGIYLLNRRLSSAKHYLRFSDKPIEEIAALSGIPDTSYFTKVFRKSEHMTALEYRRKWATK